MGTKPQRILGQSRGILWLAILLAVIAILAIAISGSGVVPQAVDTDVGTTGGGAVAVSEDAARLFAGSGQETLAVDSSIAGYPVAEAHAQLFAGSDDDSLKVDSSIAGYPVAEAHARLFAGA